VTSAEAQALGDVRGYALANRIEYAPHARLRMRERHVSREDVRSALVTAMSCQAEPDERWKVPGVDTFGDDLAVIVVIEDGVVVVTLF
jgi:hypothetical protein